MAQKRIKDKLQLTDQEIISITNSVKRLLGIEEGIAALLKMIASLGAKVIMKKQLRHVRGGKWFCN